MASTVTLPRYARTRAYTGTPRAMTPAKVQLMVDQAVATALAAAHADAKITEDRRAAKRNRNRMYMLTITLLNTLFGGMLLTKMGMHSAMVAFPLLPIVIGLFLDFLLAGWSWLRKL